MKKIFSFLTAILFAGSLMAETSTLTFSASYASKGATADDGAVWTVTSDGSESNYDATKGIHYGTSSASVTYINLSTSDIDGTITQVAVNASVGSGVSAKVRVTVGGTAFKHNEQTEVSLTTTATSYTFSGSASGEILVEVFKASKATKAIYCKSIAVTYTPASGPSLSVDPKTIDFGTVEQGETVEAQELEVTFANLTGSVTYSGLSIPFSTEGTISTSGDKITISANTETVGDYSQTLTVQSAADSKSVNVTVKMKVKTPAHKYDNTIDCSSISGFNEWTTSYTERIVEGTDANLVMASANRQTNTITDIPVTKGQDVELIVTSAGKALTAVKFVCRQWGAKEQTITLAYSTDSGENYSEFSPAVTSNEFEIEKVGLPEKTNAVKISFSSQDNQVGIKSVSYDLKSEGGGTAVDNTEVSEKAVKSIVNGQLVIEKNGVRYNAMGQVIK